MSDKKKKIIELIDSALREADLSWYQRKSTIVRCIDDIMDIVTPAPETKKCEESRADEINKLCDSAFGVGKCEEKCEIIFRCKVCASLLDECVIKECPCKCHQKEEKPVEYRVCEMYVLWVTDCSVSILRYY